MPGNKCKVHFNPDNVYITVDTGTNLLTAALMAGVHVSASCGGKGECESCKVIIESGTVDSTSSHLLSQVEYDRGIRLACQCRIMSDLMVSIPAESRLDRAVRARERSKLLGVSATGWRFNPPLIKYYLELQPATLEDNATDLFRIMYGLNRAYDIPDWPIDFDILQKLPEAIRAEDWKVTVTTMAIIDRSPGQENFSYRIINVEPGDTRDKLYSLAIDIGTTTVSAQLLDLNRGEVRSETIVLNKQSGYGPDILSRIKYSQKPGGLAQLQKLLVSSINEAINNLLSQGHIERKDISLITASCNTTMQHLLLGLSPKYIGLTPFVPVANFIPTTKACSIGIDVPEHAQIFTFPSISGFVGGDVTAGIVASGVHQRNRLTFYIDIGTNGEIVIGNSDWMVSASCSTGPAFEGGGIKFGMVAMRGAIQDITIDPVTLEPTLKTIDEARPAGLCGSGLISAIAELLTRGIIGRDGKFVSTFSSSRIREGLTGYEYVLAMASETEIGRDIVITESDIDNVIRAKATLFAGCDTLRQSVNIEYEDIEQVILAGKFGSKLDVEKAITIGLLPDIPRERFFFIGNGSLAGARLVNFSVDLLNDSRKVAQMMTNVDFSENKDFSSNYAAALLLPHSDEKRFPSILEKLKFTK